MKPSSYGHALYAKSFEGSNKSCALPLWVPTLLIKGSKICSNKMVCLSKARINRHWHRQHHLKGVATLAGNKLNSTWTTSTRNVGHVNSNKGQIELAGTNLLVLAQPELEGTMTWKSDLERQGQTILNSHFLTVMLMVGTLYLILLCQLPVWMFLKIDSLIIFLLSCIVFSIIIYCI